MQTIRTKNLLKEAGIEATPARLRVLDICISAGQPLTVEDVAKKVGGKAHLATVYRTLEKFVISGILTRIDFQEGKFRYEYVVDHHHHAICESCGSIAEIKDNNLENVMHTLKVGRGFSISRHALELFGLCHGCQLKGSHVKRTS